MRRDLSGWYAVGVLMLANLSGFIDRLILALLVPAIRRDLGLSLTETGILIGAPFAIFYSLLGLPIARLADRWSRRNVIAIGIALWSVMTAVCATAGTFWRLLFARIGVGVGEAGLQAPATALIADLFPRERLSTAMSVYSMGIFLGSGLAYFIGGWIVGLVSAESLWTVPLIGEIRPWQSVFLIVGLPGLLIALLMLTVTEPPRATTAAPPKFRALFTWMRANTRTFTCLIAAFTASATVNYGIALWLATFLITTHGWEASRAGMVQGVLTMTVGTVGVLAGGRLGDWLSRRGHVDAPLRVGLVGATGMLVSATAYPLVDSATSVVAWLVVVNFFAAFPWGVASTAAAETVPAAMRSQGAAFFYLILNLVSFAVGPWAVGAVTDYVFGADSALRYALAVVNVIGMGTAIVLFLFGMVPYRRTVQARDSWRAG